MGHLIPRHMSQLDFYLEALDRQVKLPEENPSMGILLCSSKNETVVDFVLSQSMSTAMIVEYNLNLPDSAKLSERLEEVNKMYIQHGGEFVELGEGEWRRLEPQAKG